MLGWSWVGDVMLKVTGEVERDPCSTPCTVLWHRQCPPTVSQSLCCPLHLFKSSPCLLTATLQPRLLQELPPRLLAARAACVGCEGKTEVVKVWKQA